MNRPASSSSPSRRVSRVQPFRVACAVVLLCGATAARVARCAETPASTGAVIVGSVRLPPPPPAKASPARYENIAPGAVAPPPPPVAVVYLEGVFDAPPATNEVAVMAQQGYQFSHSVLPVQRGSAVTFPNRDNAYHNVFSYSKPKRFDLGRYRKDEPPPALVFDTPGVVKLYCEIHEHMRGTILVLDTPYFTVTDGTGRFRLTGLPTGHYTLKAWVAENTVYEHAVDLRPGESVSVDLGNP